MRKTGGIPTYLVVLTFVGLGLLVLMLVAVLLATYWPTGEPPAEPRETIQCFQSLTGVKCEVRPAD